MLSTDKVATLEVVIARAGDGAQMSLAIVGSLAEASELVARLDVIAHEGRSFPEPGSPRAFYVGSEVYAIDLDSGAWWCQVTDTEWETDLGADGVDGHRDEEN